MDKSNAIKMNSFRFVYRIEAEGFNHKGKKAQDCQNLEEVLHLAEGKSHANIKTVSREKFKEWVDGNNLRFHP